jgi:hypothetical protein
MSLFDRDELRALLEETERSHLSEGAPPKQARKLTRKAFLDWLEAEISQLREEIAAVEALDQAGRDERVAGARRDFHFFRRTYLPHYYRIEERSDLQEWLERIYHRIVTEPRGLKFAAAAPRGFGKSTDVALAFLLWVIVFHLKHFITLFSDAVELTEVHIEALKAELEENPRLRQDFPDACGVGPVWKVGDIVTAGGVRVKGYGSGKRVRGVKHGTHRPDLAVIDDLENDENVRSPRQRDKLEEWLDSAVDNLGGVEGDLDIVYIGTVLHRDSVLARKLKLAFWHPKIFRALIRYPSRMDLWDRYELLYRRQGADAAHDYYLAHRSEMDEGAQLLWSAVGLESLMQKRAANPRAFERELQNNPGSEHSTFNSSTFTVISQTQMPKLERKFLYTDFKGDSVRGDYFAVIAGGFDRERRKLYIYTSHRSRIKGRKAVDFLVDLYRKERFYLVGGESNGGFYVYRDWFKDKCAEKLGLIPSTRFIHNRDKKEDRISELEFPITDGDIVFVGEHPELFRELDDFPEATHDDLSDVLAGLWRLVRLRKKSRPRTKRPHFKARRLRAYKG